MRGRGAAAPAEPRWEREVSGALRPGGSELLPNCLGGREEGRDHGPAAQGRGGGQRECSVESRFFSLETEAAEADGAGGLRGERGAVGEPRTGVAGNIPRTGDFSHFCLKDLSRCLAPEAGALEHL